MDPVIIPSFDNDPQCLIQKKLLTPGKGDSDYPDGTKLTFHYVTRLCDEEHTLIDDSRDTDFTMELILGKKFKLEVWETCVKSMKPGEVSSFTVDKILLGAYPVVAKSLRDIRYKKKAEQRHHVCGFSLHEHGVGYCDLDKLIKNPQPLEFIFELLKAEVPGEYKKESWAMSVEERQDSVPRLREEGNALFKEKNYAEAAKRYAEAIGILESLMTREKPGDDPWVELETQKTPFLLNYSQCLLFMHDYYPVIDHTSEVLKYDPDNVKALFRRAKAHMGAWNPKEAREDFKRAAQLDPTLAKTVNKEIAAITEMEKQRDEEYKKRLGGKIFT